MQAFAADAYPAVLSDWGVVVAKGNRLMLGAGVTPYDLATPLFTDYAHKLRTIWIPAGSTARFETDDVFGLPVGTVLSKTFYYPRASGPQGNEIAITEDHNRDFAGEGLDLARVRLIETRLLVHQPHGWDALAYVWNENQRDARLEIAGEALKLASQDGEFTYLVPTRNECASCHASDHTSGKLAPIGIAARHLDKDYDHYRDGTAPQLARWVSTGLLDRAGPSTLRNAIWQPGAFDDLDDRARTYLDINCGHCHNPRGSADTSGLFLDRLTTNPRALGVCKPPIAAGRGSGGRAFAIVPGGADESILVYRMVSTDPAAMMPEIGRTMAHQAGVELIRRWVDSLAPVDCGHATAL